MLKMVHLVTSQEGLNIVVKTGHTSLLLRDALRRPLAELELGAVQASLRRPTQTVMQFYCGIYVSAWSFNPNISAWEPVLESWDLIVKVDANKNSQVGTSCHHMCAVEARGNKPKCNFSEVSE